MRAGAAEGPKLHWLARVLLGAVVVVLAVGLLLILFEPQGRWVEDLVAGLMLAGLFAAVLSAAVIVTRRRSRMFVVMTVGVILSAAGTFLAMVTLLDRGMHYADREHIGKLAATGVVLGLAIVHAGTFWVIPARTVPLKIGRVLTVGLMWFFALGLLSLFWLQDLMLNRFGPILALPMSLSALLGLLGTIGVGIGAASSANRRSEREETIAARVAVELGCPRCGHRQTLRSGLHRCAGCRAAIVVEVEEPRCECGYLLYRLEGEHCPECGRRAGGGGDEGSPQRHGGHGGCTEKKEEDEEDGAEGRRG